MNSQIITAIKEQFETEGHEFFDRGKYNLNIFSVRAANQRANKFDDFIYCVYKDNYDHWRVHQWPCTTDPGSYWLRNPSRVEGTAILVPGQYKRVYKIDKHAGKYEALCQRNGTVRVYRDNNRDSIMNADITTVMTGRFGVNIHKAGKDSTQVNKWSAGCTVFKKSKDFDDFMTICRKSRRVWGNSFTYTLFEE